MTHDSLPTIQWYPGHIAKAERQLQEQLKLVDVVLEVRDLRIPLATQHPQVGEWIGSKARVLVLNRRDTIGPQVCQLWEEWFRERGEDPYLTDARSGTGIAAVKKAAQLTGVQMNQRRRDRGMRPRAVRAVVIGFPNVGKSAAINRLLGRRVAQSARRPGVTRQLRWIRMSSELELLDAPGVIPVKLKDPQAAVKLAICDDIGEAAYDNQRVAAALVDLLTSLAAQRPDLVSPDVLFDRYDRPGETMTGETYLHALAQQYNDDLERAARQLLTDFRKGLLGKIPLELPPGAR